MNSHPQTTAAQKRLIFCEIVLVPKGDLSKAVYTSLRINSQFGAYGIYSLYAVRAFGLISLDNVMYVDTDSKLRPLFLKSSARTPLKSFSGEQRMFFSKSSTRGKRFVSRYSLPVNVNFMPARGRVYLNPLFPERQYEIITNVDLT